MHETAIETEDRSYYTDRLTELTGKPRNYWSKIPLIELKQRCFKEIKQKEVNRHERKRLGPIITAAHSRSDSVRFC